MDKYKLEDLKDRLNEIATDNLINKNKNADIIKLNNKYDFNDIKKVLQEIFKTEETINFIINKNIKIKGKITNKSNDFLNKISLVKIVESRSGSGDQEVLSHNLKFFNEKIDKRFKIVESFEWDFYIYKMISNEREYLIFSIKPLELQEYEIEGMIVEMNDMADIGNYTKINLKLPVIFVNTAKEKIIKFKDHQHLFDSIPKKLTEDTLMSYLFSGEDGTYFQHPRYFERLVASFLLSAKYDSSPYPMHLLIIGMPGSGKSKVMETLHWKFQENNEITDGSCSTLKSLIPSFKSSISIQTGDLIKSNRLCCVDEFLRILVRIPSEEREPQLAALNPLLEHKIRNFGSGNYSFKGIMTAKMVAASNPVYGTSDMIRLANKIDKSFISRLLVYYQDKEHFNYVAEKDETQLIKNKLKIDNELFISIYDYLNTFKSELNKDKIDKIFNNSLMLLGSDNEDNNFIDVRSIYLARYKHHLYCLVDGLVKIRCLCNRDSNFEAIEQDYLDTEEIWSKIIRNMGVRYRDILSK